MSDAATAIYGKLSSVSGITALVGSGDDARIYPHLQPPHQRSYPMIVYRCADDDRGERYAPGRGTLVRELVSIAVVAETYDAARDLHNLVTAAIDNQRGTWGGVEVRGCFKNGGSETTQAEAEADRQFTIIESSWRIWYVSDMS